jgi:hypothetical protein
MLEKMIFTYSVATAHNVTGLALKHISNLQPVKMAGLVVNVFRQLLSGMWHHVV